MSEQPLAPHSSCNLCSINLSEYVIEPFTHHAVLDLANLANDIKHIIRVMDDIIDENKDKHALPEQKEAAVTYRNIGMGLMGLHDMLIKLNMRYGSTQAVDYCRDLMQFMFKNALYASVNLADERGNFPGYDACIWDSDIIRNNLTDDEIQALKNKGRLRNCSLLTIAPTGSIATMLGVSSGIEPLFSLEYTRRTVSLDSGKDSYYVVNAKIVDEYKRATNNDTLPNLFNTAYQIPFNERIAMQSVLQYACDTAISSTINLPADTTPDDIGKIYYIAWKAGLKGITVYVDGSRDPILSTKPAEIPNTLSPKRPDTLECDCYMTKVNKENFVVCVGLYDDRPYEVFVFRLTNWLKLPHHKGRITKIEKGKYELDSEFLHIDNLLDTDISIEEKAATLYSSMLLRHGISIKYIIKTAKKVNQNIVSFSSAMCRILGQYLQSETEGTCPLCGSKLIHEGGCIRCSSCEYSKCE